MLIDRKCIYHSPLSNYAYAFSEEYLTIRLRAGKNNLEKVTLFYADRADVVDPVRFTALDMKITFQDEFFDYFELKFKTEYKRVCYYFLLKSDEEEIYYYADMFFDYVSEIRSEYYQYPYIRRKEIFTLPEWYEKAKVYNIFPDSFASSFCNISLKRQEIDLGQNGISENRNGGTIRGIIENVDYIKNLGFNCLYLNPIFVANSYHKYDIIDYYKIDSCFGTNEDFRELVDVLHDSNIKIIIDGVFNHVSNNFFAFRDLVEKGKASKYKDWFYDYKLPIRIPVEGEFPNYSYFSYEGRMPKLNTLIMKLENIFQMWVNFGLKNLTLMDGA